MNRPSPRGLAGIGETGKLYCGCSGTLACAEGFAGAAVDMARRLSVEIIDGFAAYDVGSGLLGVCVGWASGVQVRQA